MPIPRIVKEEDIKRIIGLTEVLENQDERDQQDLVSQQLADVHLDHLVTADHKTRLHIINSSQATNHDFTLEGFSQERILFITDSPHPQHNLQQVSEFQSLLQQIGDWIKSESREMSLWLSISVFLLRYFTQFY